MPRASVKAATLAGTALPRIFGLYLAVWHNVQNLDMMYQDYVGTPAVVGSSVALQLDSAQGERRTILGPELIVNGGFDTDTDWTKSATAPATVAISGGKVTLYSPAGEATSVRQDVLTANRLYKVTGTVTVRSGTVKLDMGSVQNITTSGSFTYYMWATSTTFYLSRAGACDADFDNVSVREVITVTEQARGPEIKDTGTVGIVGVATAATYDTVTGAGTAARAADSSNQSYVEFASATIGRPYFVDIENTHASFTLQIQVSGTVFAQVGPGQRRTVFVPAITASISIRCVSNSQNIAFTVHSVKECLGTPRYQTTSAQRPILGRHPKGGRRNLLAYTENLTSGWGGATTKTIAAETYNGSPFTTVTKTTAIASEAAAQAVGVLTGGQPYTITCAFLAGTVTACQLGIHNPTDAWGASSVAVEVIEGPGAAGFSGSLFTLSGLSSTVPTVVRLTFTKATTASSTINLYPQSSGSTTIGHSVKVTRFQLETGSVATNYQAITTAYDCTEDGKPDCYFLQADGSDDGMVTPAIDLSATDKIAVFAGVRKLSDAAAGVPLELSTTASTNNGSFRFAAPLTASTSYGFRSRGTVIRDADYTDAAVAAPNTAILTGLTSIGDPVVKLRINGVERGSDASSQGTGNFGSYPFYYFRRAGASAPFNGLEYGNFIVATLPDAAQIAAGETYQNNYIEAY